jgi:hypothetical protein
MVVDGSGFPDLEDARPNMGDDDRYRDDSQSLLFTPATALV